MIKGKVLDSMQKPVSKVYISLFDSNEFKSLSKFTISDLNGEFTLEVSPPLDTVYLEFTHLSFKPKRKQIKVTSDELEIYLDNRIESLNEVVLPARKPFEIKGDTIRYDVNLIKDRNDVSIEDVIGRIPGVVINEKGQINYNGRPISHLYINGVDLLESRYNLATRGIPYSSVSDIEILKKHHHEKVTKGRLSSNDVAINLNIKKNQNLVFGSAKLDFGIPFFLGSLDATPVFIKDNVYNISSVKMNNMGVNLDMNGAELTRDNPSLISLKLSDTNVLSQPDVFGSVLPDKYWLDNQSLSTTDDFLISKKNVVLKGFFDVNSSENTIEKNQNSLYFVEQDTSVIRSKSDNFLIKRSYKLGGTFEINEDDFYLKNTILAHFNNDLGESKSTLNQNDFFTSYDSQDSDFSNTLLFKKAIGGNVIEAGAIFEKMESSQQNTVAPSVFEMLIPSSNSNFEFTNQIVASRKMNFGGYASYHFDAIGAKWAIHQKINWSDESINTNLYHSGSNSNLFPFKSDFSLGSINYNSVLNLSKNWNSYSLKIRQQLQLKSLKLMESLTDSNRSYSFLFFNPFISLSKKIDSRWSAGVNAFRNQNASSFNTLYPGIVLNSFNSLFRNPNEVNQTVSHEIAMFISYSDITKGTFIKNTTTWSNMISDYVFSNSITSDGLLEVNALKQQNESVLFKNTTSFSRRMFKNLSFYTSFTSQLNVTNQIFNGVALRNKVLNYILNLKLEWSNSNWYSVSYDLNYQLGSTVLSNHPNVNNVFQLHEAELNFYFSKKSRLSFDIATAVSTFSNSTDVNVNSVFNSNFYFKKSQKFLLNASLQNILNQKFFTSAITGDNFSSLDQFSLRPFQFSVGITYNL